MPPRFLPDREFLRRADCARTVSYTHLRKAAEQGSALGQVNLGTMYDHGHGVPQDYAQAHIWYNLAASSAEDDAARNEAAKVRDLVATKMTPAQIAEAQRMAREWMQSHSSKR